MRTLIALTAVLLTACAGSSARSRVLWPAVVSAWPQVKADVGNGAAFAGAEDPRFADVQVAIAAVGAAVAADDRTLLRGVDWTQADAMAREGIRARVNAGLLSEGVAESLLRRLNEFRDAIREVAR